DLGIADERGEVLEAPFDGSELVLEIWRHAVRCRRRAWTRTLRWAPAPGYRRQERDLVAVAHRSVHRGVLRVDGDGHGRGIRLECRVFVQQLAPHVAGGGRSVDLA